MPKTPQAEAASKRSSQRCQRLSQWPKKKKRGGISQTWKSLVFCCSNGGFLKWGYPQIIHFNRIFPYKPTILGTPNLGNPQIITQKFQSFDPWRTPRISSSSLKHLYEKCVRCQARLPKGIPFGQAIFIEEKSWSARITQFWGWKIPLWTKHGNGKSLAWRETWNANCQCSFPAYISRSHTPTDIEWYFYFLPLNCWVHNPSS